MNLNLKLTGLISLLAAACISSSCNKSHDTPAAVCHITQVEEKNGSSTLKYLVNYDNDGHVSSIVTSAGQVTTFSYVGNTVVSHPNNTGGAYYYDSIILNGSGMPAYDYNIYNNGFGGGSVSGNKFTYNADGTVATVTDVDSTNPNTVYQSKDGDINSSSDNFGNTTQYIYDTKYSSMDGDVIQWEQMKVYGDIKFFKTKHLWKGELTNPMTYVMDSTGKIYTATSFSSSFSFYADKYTFTHECK